MKNIVYSLVFLIALTFIPIGVNGDTPQYDDTVRVIYLSPSDVIRKEHYERAIQSALIDVQQWYADQLGGFSFNLEREPVEWYALPHPTAFYGEVPEGEPSLRGDLWFWDAIISDATSLLDGFWNSDDVWILYVDADPPGSQSPLYMKGLAILTANDLRGLTGEGLVPVDSGDEALFQAFGKRFQPWVGKLAHHVGAAFGLTRLTGDDGLPPLPLMNEGYMDYPNAYLGGTTELYTHEKVSSDYRKPIYKESYFPSLDNPEFERGFEPWFFYTNGVGHATRAKTGYISQYRLDVDIKKAGTNTQLLQRNIELLPNTDYLVTFTAYSRFGSDVSVSLSNDSNPYVNYGVNRRFVSFDLEPYWKVFTHRFTTKGFNTPVDDGKLLLWFADGSVDGEGFCIDDISIGPISWGTIDGPITPRYVMATAISETEMFISWEPSSKGYTNARVLGYFIYRDGELIETTTTNCFFDEGLDASHVYEYEVEAVTYFGAISENRGTVSVETMSPESLVRNGGFEEKGLYWGLANDKICDAAYSGDYSASICLRGTGGELLLYQNRLPLMSQSNYELSFYARSSLGGDVTVAVDHGLNEQPVNLTSEWNRVNLLFETPDYGAAMEDGSILFRVGPDPRPWQCYEFDNIELKQFDVAGEASLGEPTDLQSSMGSATLVYLSWEAPENDLSSLGYFIYRDGVNLGMTTERQYIDYGLGRGKEYAYYILAFDSIGRVSSPSNTVLVETPGGPSPDYNLVENSSFDQGTTFWWKQNLSAYDSILDPFEGGRYDRSCRVHFPGSPKTAKLFQTDIVLEPLTEYNLSFAARSNRIPNDEITLSLTAMSLGSTGLPIEPYSYGLEDVKVEVGMEWQTYFITFETPASFVDRDATTLTFEFKDWAGLLGSYGIDQVVITKKGLIEDALLDRP